MMLGALMHEVQDTMYYKQRYILCRILGRDGAIAKNVCSAYVGYCL